MADISFNEKKNLERLFQMGGGYVLDFSNRTFEEFVLDSVSISIYDEKYAYDSGSKANRLRAFWSAEPNHIVGKLIADLVDYTLMGHEVPRQLQDQCRQIGKRLSGGAAVDGLEAITPEGNDRGFDVLAKAVLDSINRNEPEAGLDRLHTYTVKLIRHMSAKRGIAVDRGKALHSIFGEYVKVLRSAGLVESEMTERILKNSISLLEAFNRVRNEQSLAHDNPTLRFHESILIYTSVCSSIRFLRAIEV